MIDDPVSTQKYTIYDIDSLPKVILCINVKNKYDETRLLIKPKYNPKFVCHFQNIHGELQPSYYYGTELDIKSEYASMIKYMRKNTPVNLDKYRDILSQYDLSCSTCYGYFGESVWPLDLKHLQSITKRDWSTEIASGFNDMVKFSKRVSDIPIYKRVMNFNILILSKSIEYDK
jgi:hypothetical protein